MSDRKEEFLRRFAEWPEEAQNRAIVYSLLWLINAIRTNEEQARVDAVAGELLEQVDLDGDA